MLLGAGAYYYYLTENGGTYEDTFLALKKHVDEERIPIRWILYDRCGQIVICIASGAL